MEQLCRARRSLADAIAAEGTPNDDEELERLSQSLQEMEQIVAAAIAARVLSHANPDATLFEEGMNAEPFSEFASEQQQRLMRKIGLEMRTAICLPYLETCLLMDEDPLEIFDRIGDCSGVPSSLMHSLLDYGLKQCRIAARLIEEKRLTEARESAAVARNFYTGARIRGFSMESQEAHLTLLEAEIDELLHSARQRKASKKRRRKPGQKYT